MDATFLAVVAIVFLALVCDFTNGSHDAPNAIATSISPRSLTLRVALTFAAEDLGTGPAAAIVHRDLRLIVDVGQPNWREKLMKPEHVQILHPGVHLAAEDGVCLMESVSLIAGAPFSDTPRCTDPAVAVIAHLVNYAMTDTARSSLVVLAPRLATCRRTTGHGSSAIVVEAATTEALARAGADHRLELNLADSQSRQARREGGPRIVRKLMEVMYRRGRARHALARSVVHVDSLSPTERDVALRALLESSINAVAKQQTRRRLADSHG